MKEIDYVGFLGQELLQCGKMDTRYEQSPFKNFNTLSIKERGRRYEEITERLYVSCGSVVSKSHNTEYDRIIDNKRCEIKGAMLGFGKNTFTFNQIRPNQDYDSVLFVMFNPNTIRILEMDKTLINKYCSNNVFKHHHGGNKGDSHTYIYVGNAETLSNLGAIEFEWQTHYQNQ